MSRFEWSPRSTLAGLVLGCGVLNAAASVPPLPVWTRGAGPAAPAVRIAHYDASPLPPEHDVDAPTQWTANPFAVGAAGPLDDAAGKENAPPPLPAEADEADEAPRTSELATDPATAPAAPPRAAPGPAVADVPLEGPPVPLPAPFRLGGATTGSDGLPPDRPITLDFQRAEIGAVFHTFAQFTKLNIVASERVRGQVTLRLERVPWRTAFDLLLEANDLAMERIGDVIWIAPVAELAARARQRYEAHARAAELEPLASRAFELHYARAEDLRRLLSGAGNQRALSKRGAAVADTRTNLLFVTDLPARLEQIAALVARLDEPTRQVLIEARIVEGDAGLSREIGVRLGVMPAGAGGQGNQSGAVRGVQGGKDGTVYDLSAGPLAGFDAAQIGLTLLAAHATRLLDVELSALEADGRGRVVSSPRVVTADRTRAIVEQGTELPYQAKVGQGVSGVQFRRASLKLEVEPQITPDGRVILELDVAKDSVGEQTASGPAINTKHVQTRVEIEDGGTVSIGGIDASDDRDDVTRVPLLGKIPLLGALFSHRAHRDRRTELVVFITPRVVDANRPQ